MSKKKAAKESCCKIEFIPYIEITIFSEGNIWYKNFILQQLPFCLSSYSNKPEFSRKNGKIIH
jgi:hypothetical protein